LITTTVRDVYLVTTSRQRFIFFVYRWGHRTYEEIATEWQFVAYLDAHGVSVAPAVPTTNGDLIIAFNAPEGTRYGVLTTFVQGHHLRQRSSIPAVRSYGRTVAMIHVLADALPDALNRPIIDMVLLIEQAVNAAETTFLDRPDVVAYLQWCATQLFPKLASLTAKAPAYGIIHGDVIRTNALVSDYGTITVLDFDFCGTGWRAYDIASYLLTVRGTPHELEFAEAFLAGYSDVRSLTPTDHAALPLFEAVRAILDIGTPAQLC
jgi:Ser/Thr protein kinase RdoA (MazF antagonist)